MIHNAMIEKHRPKEYGESTKIKDANNKAVNKMASPERMILFISFIPLSSLVIYDAALYRGLKASKFHDFRPMGE